MATFDLTPPQINFIITQGQSVVVEFTFSSSGMNIDITGWGITMQVRRTAGSPETIISAGIDHGIFVTDPTMGKFEFVLTPQETAGIVFKKDEEWIDAVYDLELRDPDGFVFKPCHGTFTVNREVTR